LTYRTVIDRPIIMQTFWNRLCVPSACPITRRPCF